MLRGFVLELGVLIGNEGTLSLWLCWLWRPLVHSHRLVIFTSRLVLSRKLQEVLELGLPQLRQANGSLVQYSGA